MLAAREKRLISVILTAVVASSLSGCLCPAFRNPDPVAPYRIGINFIPLGALATVTAYNELHEILADLEDLGAGGIRQLTVADMGWCNLYDLTAKGPYDDDGSYVLGDARDWFCRSDGPYAIPTLFQTGPDAAANECGLKKGSVGSLILPDGTDLADMKTDAALEDAVRGYVQVLATRFAFVVRHWEIANELSYYPPYYNSSDPTNAACAERSAYLLYVCADELKSWFPDYQVVVGGLAGTELAVLKNQALWLETVLDEIDDEGYGDVVDVVSFHFYGPYTELAEGIGAVQDAIGTRDLPLWLTEVGTSNVTKDKDQEEQARDVFRLFSVAFGNGVELCNWHTYISGSGSGFRGYGLRDESTGNPTLAYYTYQLFADKLGEFATCREISGGAAGTGELGEDGVWAYLYYFPGGTLSPGGGVSPRTPSGYKWVIWTSDSAGTTYDLEQVIDDLGLPVTPWLLGTATVTATHVVPDSSGVFTTSTMPRDELELTTTPILITVAGL